MPIAAGGILVAATATTRCLSSAAGMLRFLARLSGRRRHVRRFRSCLLSGPGAAAVAAAAAAGEEGRTAAAAAGGGGGGGGSGGNGGGGGGSGSRPHQQPPQQPQLQQPHQSQSELQSARIMEEETTTLVVPTEECTRCRCRSSCSCALLGLDDVDCTSSSSGRTIDDSTSSRSSNTPRRRRRRPEQELSAAVRSDRDHSSRTPCGRTDRDVLRRRPPESTSRALVPPPYLATLLILSYSLIGMADACSSRSTPKPRPPTPTPRPNITFHMYTCPPDYAEWYCLNGATCFTVKIVDSLLYNCLCANGYIGQRCEFKDLDGSYLPSRQRVMLETASIAGAVTIAVFLAVITFISVYIHCKRKQKELRTSSGVDAVDGLVRDPELRPFCNRSRSLMTFMAKNPNCSTTPPSIEHTRMPNWNYPAESSAQVASVNENKCPSQ